MRRLYFKIQLPSYLDGAFYCLMVGLGEIYFVSAALDAGLNEKFAASLAVTPILIASILQMFTPLVVKILGGLKRAIVGAALLQACTMFYLGVLIVSGFPPSLLKGLYLLGCVLYYVFDRFAGTLWNAWIAQIIPLKKRTDFFTKRTASHFVVELLALVGAGKILYGQNIEETSQRYFFAMFIAAGLFRFISSYYLWLQPEGKQKRESLKNHPVFKRGTSFSRQNHPQKKFWPMLVFLFLVNFTTFISAPFFNPFLLSQLKMHYEDFTLLTIALFVSRIVTSYLCGFFVKKWRENSLMIIAALLLTPMPYLWTLSEHLYWFVLCQIVAGAALMCYELGVMLGLMDRVNHLQRVHFLNWSNFINALGMVLGLVLGSYLLGTGELTKDSYYSVFIIAAWLRFLIILVLPLWTRGSKIARSA